MSTRRAPAAALALAGGCVLVAVVVVLSQPYRLREPDPYAYRAAVRALQQGELRLDDAAYIELDSRLIAEGDGWERRLEDPSPSYVASAPPGGCPQRRGSFTGPLFGEPPPLGIAQWVRTTEGTCVSEKSPGWPVVLAPLEAIGLLRLAPLAAGALGLAGLAFGVRRWLGRRAAGLGVALALTPAGALIMAHRAYMPSFADALLLAGGAGLVLGAVSGPSGSPRRQALVGVAGFFLLGLSVTMRVTNLVPALVVLAWVVLAVWRGPFALRSATVGWWVFGAVPPALALAGYHTVVFGAPWRQGYELSGSATEAWGVTNVGHNVAVMPWRLTTMYPLWLLAVAGVAVAVLAPRLGEQVGAPARERADAPTARSRRVVDRWVLGLAVAWWVSVWWTYLLFEWTWRAVPDSSHPIVTARFYLPALGALVLLGTWLLDRLPVAVSAAIVMLLLAVGALATLDALGTGWAFEVASLGLSARRPVLVSR